MDDIARKADILGIILFIILFYYFYNMDNRTTFENLLFLCIGIALIVDFIFVYTYFINNKFVPELTD